MASVLIQFTAPSEAECDEGHYVLVLDHVAENGVLVLADPHPWNPARLTALRSTTSSPPGEPPDQRAAVGGVAPSRNPRLSLPPFLGGAHLGSTARRNQSHVGHDHVPSELTGRIRR